MARCFISHRLYPIYILVALALLSSPSMSQSIRDDATFKIPADSAPRTTTPDYVSSLRTTTIVSPPTKESTVFNAISGTSPGSTFFKSQTQESDSSQKSVENQDDGDFSGLSMASSVSETLGPGSNLALNADDLNGVTPVGSARDLNIAVQYTRNTHVTSSITDGKTSLSSDETPLIQNMVAADEDSSGHFEILTATSEPTEEINQLVDETSSENTSKTEPVVVLNEYSTETTPSSHTANPSNNDTIFNPSSFFIPVIASSKQSTTEHIESLMEDSTSVSFHKSDEHRASIISSTTQLPRTPQTTTGTSKQETVMEAMATDAQKTTTLPETSDDKHPIQMPVALLTDSDPTVPNVHITGEDGANLVQMIKKDRQTVGSTTSRSSETTQQMPPIGGPEVTTNTLSKITREHATSETKKSSKVTEFLNQKSTLSTTTGIFDSKNELERTTEIPKVQLETQVTMKEDLTSSNIKGTVTSSENVPNPTPVTTESVTTMETRGTSHIVTHIALESHQQATNPVTDQSKTFSLPVERSSDDHLSSMHPSTGPSLREMIAYKSSLAPSSSVNPTILPTMTTDDLTLIKRTTAPTTPPRGNVISSNASTSTQSSSGILISPHAPTNVSLPTIPHTVQNTKHTSVSTKTDNSTPGFQTGLPVTSTEQQESNWSLPKGQTATTASDTQAVTTSPGRVTGINQTDLPQSGTMPSEPPESLTSPRASIAPSPTSTAPPTAKTLEMATNESPGTDIASEHLNTNTQSPEESVSPSQSSQRASAYVTDTEVNVEGSETRRPDTTSSTPPTKLSSLSTEVITYPASSAGDSIKDVTVGMSTTRESSEASSLTGSTRTSLSKTPKGKFPDASIFSTPTKTPLENFDEATTKLTSKPFSTTEGNTSTDAPVYNYTEPTGHATDLTPDSRMDSDEERQTTTKSKSSTASLISTDFFSKQYTSTETTSKAVKILDRTYEPVEKPQSTTTTDSSNTYKWIPTSTPSEQYISSQTTGKAVEIPPTADQSRTGVSLTGATVPSVSQTRSLENETRTKTQTGNNPVDATTNPRTTTTTAETTVSLPPSTAAATTTKSSETLSFGSSSSTAIYIRTSTTLSHSSPTTKPFDSLEQTTANTYTSFLSARLTDVTSNSLTPSLRNSPMPSIATITETLTSLTPSGLSTTLAAALTEESTTTSPPQTHTKRQPVETTSIVSQRDETTHQVTRSTSSSPQTSTVESKTGLLLETSEAQTSLHLTHTTEEQVSSQSQTTNLYPSDTSRTPSTAKETETLLTGETSSSPASSPSSRRSSSKTSGSTSTASSSLHVETLLPTSEGSSTDQVTECGQLGNDCNRLTENCVNFYGKYQCECKRGYYKNHDSECVAGVSFYGSLRIYSESRDGSTTKHIHYTPELNDPKSSIYKEFAEKVQNMLDLVFLGDPTSTSTYKGCQIIQFVSGSVVAEFQLTLADVFAPLNETVLQRILHNAVDDGTVKNISGLVISSSSVLVTSLDECAKKVHDCSVFATCLDHHIGFSCTCNSGYRDLHHDVIPGRYCQSVDRPNKPLTSQMHVIVAIVLTTSIVVLVTVTALLAFVHRTCWARRTSSRTAKMPTVTAPRKISDAFLAGDVEAGVWCPTPGEDADGWSTGSSSSTCPDAAKTNSKNGHMAPIARIPESEFEIGHDVNGGINEARPTVCSKSKKNEPPLVQHKLSNSPRGNTAPSSGQEECPDLQRGVRSVAKADDRRC